LLTGMVGLIPIIALPTLERWEMLPVPWADCLNVKSEERVVYKELNSTGTLIQKTTMEAPHETLCITSDWMFTRRRLATA
jgi:hypothetical protein